MKIREFIYSANTGLDAIKRAPVLDYPTDLRCIRIQDISQHKEFSEWAYTETSINDYQKYKLCKNDILVARTGATVGVSYIVEDDIEAVFNNGSIRLKVNNNADAKFLYYLINSKEFLSYIDNVSCVATQPNLRIENLLRFDSPNFSVEIQKRIANILSAYDDLIENNNHRIALLEKAAQKLYKEWFVRFRFPDYENTRFENGIPEGWKIKNLFDIANVTYGYAFKSDLFCDDKTLNPVVRIRDIPDNQTNTYTIEHCDDKYLINENSIVIGMDGIFHMCLWNGGKAYLNQRVVMLDSKYANLNNLYLYYSLYPQVKYWEQTIAGTTVAHLGDKHLKKIYVLLPTEDILEKSHIIFNNLMLQKTKLFNQNQNLIKQRDLLLPRLMSGKLEV